MRPAVGAVRDRALHVRLGSEAALPLVARARSSGGRSFAVHRQSASQCFVAGDALAGARRHRSLPCLRLVAPVENRARLGFATLAPYVLALPRRSCRMVSSRAYSSPAPQPASRHIIKPFSIDPVIANIRHTAGFRSHDVRRRWDE